MKNDDMKNTRYSTQTKKTLKFARNLVPLVLSGEKTSTWRIHDDKDLQVGDILDLLYQGTKETFAEARITTVTEKKMGELTDDDKHGHEKFSSNEEMYQTYSKYYNFQVGPDTRVKIVKFKLLTSIEK